MADWTESIWNLPLPQLKALYLHYLNAYDQQTWQGSDLSWGATTHKITCPFDHVIL